MMAAEMTAIEDLPSLMASFTTIQFVAVQIDDRGLGYRYSHAGSGAPVIVFCGASAQATTFHDLLAQKFAVTLVSTGPTGPDAADIGVVATALGVAQFALICREKAAVAGLDYALASPALLSRLILIAPDILQPENYNAVTTPVLVLEGTIDRGPTDAGQALAGSLPECYDILVYDATQDVDFERPEATASIVADFVERGSGFTVTKPQGPIYP